MSTNSQKKAFEDLPDDPAALKRLVMQQREIINSHEAAKAQRVKDAAIAAESPAGAFEMDVFNMKAELEGLADGSGADPTDPLERGRICSRAGSLLTRLLDALPKK